MRHLTLARLTDEESDVMTAAIHKEVDCSQHAEERLQQAQRMEAMGRLLSGVTHDFNNLVTIMAGYSSMLLDHLTDDDPLYEAAEEIKKASERAASLVRQLMAFGRKQSTEWRVLDLNAIVSGMEKMLRRLIGEDIELITILDQALAPVWADACQIEQVIVNLAINARDAMPLGGRLTIATANGAVRQIRAQGYDALHPDPDVRLSVCDTGCGMSAETRARLFEPFFSTKKRDEGTGLGLAMVHEIVKHCGGTIQVDSAPGLGTTFDIRLPRAEAAAAPCVSSRSLAASRHGSETILVVEDEKSVRSLLRSVLQRHGYTVLEAPHGKAALLLATRYEGQIHLLLTDVVMPYMSGRDLARCMAPLRPDMKILYMSGYTSSAHHPQSLGAAEMAFLHKPFVPDDLTRQVRGILDRPQAETTSR